MGCKPPDGSNDTSETRTYTPNALAHHGAEAEPPAAMQPTYWSHIKLHWLAVRAPKYMAMMMPITMSASVGKAQTQQPVSQRARGWDQPVCEAYRT